MVGMRRPDFCARGGRRGRVVGAASLALAMIGAFAPAARAAIEIGGDRIDRVVECHDDALSLRGNDNRLQVGGSCSAVRIEGSGNRLDVALAPGAAIVIRGNDDVIRFRPAPGATGKTAPTIDAQGQRNDVVAISDAAASAAVPSIAVAGPITIDGHDEARDLVCAGRAVRIVADNDLIVLRGGCGALEVAGSGNRIVAELAPWAPAGIAGSRNRLWMVATPAGPAPEVGDTGSANRIASVSAIGALPDAR